MSILLEVYENIRAETPPNTILLMKIGHFYESFGDAAKTVSNITGATLTRRQGVIMAGIPYHAIDFAMAKLVNAGHKIAIINNV